MKIYIDIITFVIILSSLIGCYFIISFLSYTLLKIGFTYNYKLYYIFRFIVLKEKVKEWEKIYYNSKPFIKESIRVDSVIKIKKDLIPGFFYGCIFINEMKKYSGLEAKVTHIGCFKTGQIFYYLDIDEEKYFWTAQMFED